MLSADQNLRFFHRHAKRHFHFTKFHRHAAKPLIDEESSPRGLLPTITRQHVSDNSAGTHHTPESITANLVDGEFFKVFRPLIGHPSFQTLLTQSVEDWAWHGGGEGVIKVVGRTPVHIIYNTCKTLHRNSLYI